MSPTPTPQVCLWLTTFLVSAGLLLATEEKPVHAVPGERLVPLSSWGNGAKTHPAGGGIGVVLTSSPCLVAIASLKTSLSLGQALGSSRKRDDLLWSHPGPQAGRLSLSTPEPVPETGGDWPETPQPGGGRQASHASPALSPLSAVSCLWAGGCAGLLPMPRPWAWPPGLSAAEGVWTLLPVDSDGDLGEGCSSGD